MPPPRLFDRPRADLHLPACAMNVYRVAQAQASLSQNIGEFEQAQIR